LSFGGTGNFRGTRLGASAYALLARIVGELTTAATAPTEPKKRLLDKLFMRTPQVRRSTMSIGNESQRQRSSRCEQHSEPLRIYATPFEWAPVPQQFQIEALRGGRACKSGLAAGRNPSGNRTCPALDRMSGLDASWPGTRPSQKPPSSVNSAERRNVYILFRQPSSLRDGDGAGIYGRETRGIEG
jgi:hypothetical protein